MEDREFFLCDAATNDAAFVARGSQAG